MEYEAEVCRIGYGFAKIRVEAESDGEAWIKICENAGGFEYSEKDSEYVVEMPKEVGEWKPPSVEDAPNVMKRNLDAMRKILRKLRLRAERHMREAVQATSEANDLEFDILAGKDVLGSLKDYNYDEE